jgi:hypothetical protein
LTKADKTPVETADDEKNKGDHVCCFHIY